VEDPVHTGNLALRDLGMTRRPCRSLEAGRSPPGVFSLDLPFNIMSIGVASLARTGHQHRSVGTEPSRPSKHGVLHGRPHATPIVLPIAARACLPP